MVVGRGRLLLTNHLPRTEQCSWDCGKLNHKLKIKTQIQIERQTLVENTIINRKNTNTNTKSVLQIQMPFPQTEQC